jgi:hypothetical protein
MTFQEVLAQVIAWLQREQRVSYRVLKWQLDVDDDYLEGLKDELIYAKHLAVDEDGRVLIWTDTSTSAHPPAVLPTPERERAPLAYTPAASDRQDPRLPCSPRRRAQACDCPVCRHQRFDRVTSSLDLEDARKLLAPALQMTFWLPAVEAALAQALEVG